MSQPKRRSRKSKLVPRSTEGGEPQIEEVIESEEDEPPIKIMNTMSLAKPGSIQPTGSIQFKVDIEVEEWVDDELFIEENFNKMKSELSEALDKEISDEADWTNEEYGKMWAEAASDNESDDKPTNEYEKIIKNQVDFRIINGPSTDKPGSSKDDINEFKPERSKVNILKKSISKESDIIPGTSKVNDIRPGTSKENDIRPGTSKENDITQGTTKENNIRQNTTKENNIRPGTSKENDITPSSTIENNIRPETSKENGITPGSTKAYDIRPETSKENDIRPGTSKGDNVQTFRVTSEHAKIKLKSLLSKNNPNVKKQTKIKPKEPSSRSLLKRPPVKNAIVSIIIPTQSIRPYTVTPLRQYRRPGSKLIEVTPGEKSSETTANEKTKEGVPTTEQNTSSNGTVYEKTFIFQKTTANVDPSPKEKINTVTILYSDEAAETYHINIEQPSTDPPNNNEVPKTNDPPPTKNEVLLTNDVAVTKNDELATNYFRPKKKNGPRQRTSVQKKRKGHRMTITELAQFANTQTPNKDNNVQNNAMVSLNQIIVSDDCVLSESKSLASKSLDWTDKYLDIELRNRMGNTRFTALEISREDALIDFAIRQWLEWIGPSTVKTAPISYKCYICKLGWWDLHPFRYHLKKHARVRVTFLNLTDECHFIAFDSKADLSNVGILGECGWCGRGYMHHLIKHNLGNGYVCDACKNKLPTCKALAEHEGVCLNMWKEQMERQKTKDIKAYKCKICPQIFFTEERLHSHQYRCHVPRSDYPMPMSVSQCTFCNQSYSFFSFHYCSRKIQKFRCRYCSRHFPSMAARAAHLRLVKDNVICRVCKDVVAKECFLPRHLLMHNTNYVMVYKCLICVGKHILLEDVTMVTRHAEFVHKMKKYVRSMWCYAQVLLPISLFTLKSITTRHTPTPMHDKLKESFIKDMLRGDPRRSDAPDRNDDNDSEDNYRDSPVPLEYQEPLSEDGQEPKEESEEAEPPEPSETVEPPEDKPPKIKVENIMENYFEEESPNIETEVEQKVIDTSFKKVVETEVEQKVIDTSFIKVEVDENLEGNEVDPAELMPESEFLKIKKEEPDTDIDIEMDNLQNFEQVMDVDDTKHIQDEDFSEKLQRYLSNRDENEEEEKKDVNICLNCDFEGTKKQFKAHLKTCDSGEMIKKNQDVTCSKCEKSFMCITDYVKHLPKHGFVRCKCTECDRVFPNISSWVIHIKMHIRRTYTVVKLMSTDSDVFRCRFCKDFVERKLFFKHWESQHLEVPQKKKTLQELQAITGCQDATGRIPQDMLKKIEDIFAMTKSNDIPKNCIICERYFSRLSEKKRHLVEHLLEDAAERVLTQGGLVCQFCGSKINKPDEYRHHMRDHADLTMYHCELCSKTFSDSSNFVKHKKVHAAENAYTCDLCNKKFLSKTSLAAHIAGHRSEPINCMFCPTKEFYSESAYKRHLRARHYRHRGFRCAYCRERFPSLKEKWDHLWEAHKVRSQIADCPMCDQKFRKALDLKNHVLNDHNMKTVVSFVSAAELAESAKVKVEGSPNTT